MPTSGTPMLSANGGQAGGLERLGLALSAVSSGLQGQLPQFMAQQQAFQKGLRQEQEALQTRKNISNFLTGSQALSNDLATSVNPLLGRATPELNPIGRVPVQAQPGSATARAQAAPNPMTPLFSDPNIAPIIFEQQLNRMLAPPQVTSVSAGETIGQVVPGKGFVPLYTAPAKADKPASVQEFEYARDNFGYKGTLQQYEAEKAAASRAPTGQFVPISKDEAAALGLPAGGTYQRDVTTNKVDVVVQPKQEQPTESQAQAAFLAGNIADSLGRVKRVLEKDPSATTSYWLEKTDDTIIPFAEDIARATVSPNQQIVRNNLAPAIDNVITLGTGAAYTREQLKAARDALLPRASEPFEVRQDKFGKFKEMYGRAKEKARLAGQTLPDVSEFNFIFAEPSQSPRIGGGGGGGGWGRAEVVGN